jgi:hypothetical protein
VEVATERSKDAHSISFGREERRVGGGRAQVSFDADASVATSVLSGCAGPQVRRLARALACVLALCVGVAVFEASAARAQAPEVSGTLADQLRRCGEIAGDAERLQCYDVIGRSGTAKADVLRLPEDAPEDGPRPEPRAAHAIRAEVGYGVAIGDYAGALGLPAKGYLEANSATGGSGGGLEGAIWFDGWPARSLSVGIQYFQVDNRGALDATLPKGLSVLTDPVYGHLAVSVQADLVMLNLAWRPSGYRRIRPVVGVGLGAGYGTASEHARLSNAFIGTTEDVSKASSPFPALQGFVGVEADLTDRIYLSVIPRIVLISGHPVGVNQRYADFILGADIGYRFR